MTRTTTADSPSLAGRTLVFRFEDGPTAGSAYEHRFHEDGSLEFLPLEEGKRGKPKREPRYAAFELAPEVHLASYRSDSGWTLSVAMNLRDGRLRGVASNGEEWHPVSGRVEVVD